MPFLSEDELNVDRAARQRLAQARQRRFEQEGRWRDLDDIRSRLAPGVNDDLIGMNDDPSFFQVMKNVGVGALDVLQRGNYAVAGFAEEMFVNRTGPIAAVGRVAQELLSGIGGIEGQKETFRDVLDGLDVFSERTLSEEFDLLDKVPIVGGVVGGFNIRGSVGLALDIFTDPLTYLTGGGAALAKVGKARKVISGGRARILQTTDDATEAFTKAGVKKRAALADEELERLRTRTGRKVDEAELSREATRLQIERVQDTIHTNLLDQGAAVGKATEATQHLVAPLLVRSDEAADATKALNTYLDTLDGKTATQLRKAVGLKGGPRSAIGQTVADRVQSAADDMLRAGFNEDLALLAGDIAMKRATDAILQLGKDALASGQKNLYTKEIRALAFMGMPFGPKGKSLTEAVVRSGVGSRTIGAINRWSKGDNALLGFAAKSAQRVGDGINFAGRILNGDWTARKLAGFNVVKRAHIEATAAAVSKEGERIRSGKLAAWYYGILKATNASQREEVFRTFAHAVDTGDWSKLDAPAKEAALEFQGLTREYVAVDVRKGLMHNDNVRRHYFPHFIDHPEELIEKMQAARPGRSAHAQSTIGRHAEQRGFDTLADIEKAAKMLGVDARINYDPVQALLKRSAATIEGSMFVDFYNSVGKAFGKEHKDFLMAREMFDLTRNVVDPASKAALVVERLARRGKGVPGPTLRRLHETYGEEAVGQYLIERLRRIQHPKHLARFIDKYEGYLQALPRNPFAETLAPDGSRYISMPTQYKGMGSYRIPESAAKTIKEMSVQTARSPEVAVLLEGFDSVQNRLKIWLTALFPSFHFRNKYSNVAQNFLDIGLGALNLRSAKVARELRKLTLDDPLKVQSQLGKRAQAVDLNATAWVAPNGRKVSLREARAELERNNIVKGHADIFEQTTVERVRGRAPKGTVPFEGLPKWKQKMLRYREEALKMGGKIEAEDRIVLYTTLRRRGLSELEATERVNKLLFDYSDLTEVERTYLKRAIPFYVWTKKNVALQAHAIRHMPGRVSNIVKPLNNEDDDVQGGLLEYQTGQFRLQLGRDGKSVRMLTGIDLPIMSIDRLLPIGKIYHGDFDGALKQVAAQMTPFLRVPAELMANEQFFNEKSLDRTTSHTIGKLLEQKAIPQAVRNWMGYDKVTYPGGRTSYTFDGKKFHLLFRSWITSRALSSSDRWFRQAANDVSIASNMLNVLTSLKDDEHHLDEMYARKVRERADILEQALIEKGVLMRRKKNTTFELKTTPMYKHERGPSE